MVPSRTCRFLSMRMIKPDESSQYSNVRIPLYHDIKPSNQLLFSPERTCTFFARTPIIGNGESWNFRTQVRCRPTFWLLEDTSSPSRGWQNRRVILSQIFRNNIICWWLELNYRSCLHSGGQGPPCQSWRKQIFKSDSTPQATNKHYWR